MDREKIEHLLVEYASGGISVADKQELEELFRQDPLLKQEAEEMASTWNSMHQAETSSEPYASMDKHFYAMLNASKKAQKPDIIIFRQNWVKIAFAAAACIAAFATGRISADPEQVIKYKTVYIKAPGTNKDANITPADIKSITPSPVNSTLIKSNENTIDPILAQKLRSVYASERIGAIIELSTEAKLNKTVLKLLELALSEDPNPNVRLVIINSLQPLAARPDVQDVLISSLNRQEDVLIQSSILDLLVDVKSTTAIPQMIALLENKDTDAIIQKKIKDGVETFLYPNINKL